MLFSAKDKAGQFLRETLAPTLVYTARVTPTIAHSIDDVDRVMKWGFAWELGPFELFDAIGVREVLDAAQAAGGHARRRRRRRRSFSRCWTRVATRSAAARCRRQQRIC